MNKRTLLWNEQKEAYEQRQPLYWKDMEIGQVFEPFAFAITEEVAQEVREITGARDQLGDPDQSSSMPGNIVPQAISMIFGRLSYLGEKYRPAPGGILLGISFWFIKPAQIGDIITSRAKVIAKEERKGKKYFALRCESVNQHGEMISIMEQEGILPL